MRIVGYGRRGGVSELVSERSGEVKRVSLSRWLALSSPPPSRLRLRRLDMSMLMGLVLLLSFSCCAIRTTISVNGEGLTIESGHDPDWAVESLKSHAEAVRGDDGRRGNVPSQSQSQSKSHQRRQLAVIPLPHSFPQRRQGEGPNSAVAEDGEDGAVVSTEGGLGEDGDADTNSNSSVGCLPNFIYHEACEGNDTTTSERRGVVKGGRRILQSEDLTAKHTADANDTGESGSRPPYADINRREIAELTLGALPECLQDVVTVAAISQRCENELTLCSLRASEFRFSFLTFDMDGNNTDAAPQNMASLAPRGLYHGYCYCRCNLMNCVAGYIEEQLSLRHSAPLSALQCRYESLSWCTTLSVRRDTTCRSFNADTLYMVKKHHEDSILAKDNSTTPMNKEMEMLMLIDPLLQTPKSCESTCSRRIQSGPTTSPRLRSSSHSARALPQAYLSIMAVNIAISMLRQL